MNKFACGKGGLRICARGFTLAEVMIVLVVIGVITGILLPTAIQSTPDENVMKFKKGYNTLGQVIRELVTSDKYYKDGDLGIRANGELVNGAHEGDATYFCNTFAQVVNVKKINCLDIETSSDGVMPIGKKKESWIRTEEEAAVELDAVCLGNQSEMQEEIITTDDIVFYNSNPRTVFGMNVIEKQRGNIDEDCDEYSREWCSLRWFGKEVAPTWSDDGIIIMYKVFCMDVDGINKGEDPFGFGIRVDGKIFSSARAQEWINKSIQEDD